MERPGLPEHTPTRQKASKSRIEVLHNVLQPGSDDFNVSQEIGTQAQLPGKVQVVIGAQEGRVGVLGGGIEAHGSDRHGIGGDRILPGDEDTRFFKPEILVPGTFAAFHGLDPIDQ